MFSLILSIIAIALVIIITLAVMYYGGAEVFSKGTEEAMTAQALNELSQIEGAMFSYQVNENTSPGSLEDLETKGHLREVPKGWVGSDGDGSFGVKLLEIKDPEQEQRMCENINKRLGHGENYAPACSDVLGAGSSFKGCCLGD